MHLPRIAPLLKKFTRIDSIPKTLVTPGHAVNAVVNVLAAAAVPANESKRATMSLTNDIIRALGN